MWKGQGSSVRVDAIVMLLVLTLSDVAIGRITLDGKGRKAGLSPPPPRSIRAGAPSESRHRQDCDCLSRRSLWQEGDGLCSGSRHVTPIKAAKDLCTHAQAAADAATPLTGAQADGQLLISGFNAVFGTASVTPIDNIGKPVVGPNPASTPVNPTL
ncbi:hypothetical protein F5148DRAFT_1146558 [Russula earlei]|uniref:Uncharacterized protein n=1 Tax=Russula earlei TaxID=71964 RepID=A0ACC0UJD3_9AGAM|nr:hypothetical protein F5148DRAFT_1146558 [Russula earlei]